MDDLVEGLIRLMDSDIVTPVNIGNPREFTILELAKLAIEVSIVHLIIKSLSQQLCCCNASMHCARKTCITNRVSN